MKTFCRSLENEITYSIKDIKLKLFDKSLENMSMHTTLSQILNQKWFTHL